MFQILVGECCKVLSTSLSVLSYVLNRTRQCYWFLSLSLAVFTFLVGAITPTFAEQSSVPICSSFSCGVLKDGTYDHIVVGTVTRVATEEEFHRVFDWAKAHDMWKSLPENFNSYMANVKLVQIDISAANPKEVEAPINLFMQIEEYTPAPPAIGDLVRYAPHDKEHYVTPDQQDRYALFYGLTGCIAILCRKEDKACFNGFGPGAYRKDTGAQIDPATNEIKANGSRIDTVTARLLRAS